MLKNVYKIFIKLKRYKSCEIFEDRYYSNQTNVPPGKKGDENGKNAQNSSGNFNSGHNNGRRKKKIDKNNENEECGKGVF